MSQFARAAFRCQQRIKNIDEVHYFIVVDFEYIFLSLRNMIFVNDLNTMINIFKRTMRISLNYKVFYKNRYLIIFFFISFTIISYAFLILRREMKVLI